VNTVRSAFGSAAVITSLTFLAACGGGGSHSSAIPVTQPTNASTAPTYTGPRSPASVTITIPSTAAAPSANRRAPQYVAASTRSVAVQVLSVNGASVSDAAVATNVTPGTAPCSTVSGGNYTCTLTASLPLGSDTIQIGTYDATGATGNLLSQNATTHTIVQGQANQIGTSASPITLDANPGALSVVALSGPSGTYPTFTQNGTGTATFTVTDADAHGTAFGTQPGIPTITHALATGTGASASISGTTLSVTPPSSGSTTVVVDADPAGTQDVTTTLSSAVSAGATSFTVASASGISVGQNLVLDYEGLSGSTLLQEAVKVTGVSGSTINLASALAHAHASGAAVRHYSDNLTSAAALFTMTVVQSVIAPVGAYGTTSKALVFNTSFVQQTGTLSSTTAAYNFARFDASDNLYIGDQANYTVYRTPFSTSSGFGSTTTYSGIPPSASQNGNISFDVSTNGALVVENSLGVTPQLDVYAAGQSSSPATFTTSTLNAATWETATEYGFPTVAILADTSGTPWGYAYDVFNVGGSPNDEIVVTNGAGSEQDISGATITSQFGNDPTPAVLTENIGRQSLIYVNSHVNGSGQYTVLEFPRNGTSGASLQTTPTTVGSSTNTPAYVAASPDGTYVAVAWAGGAGYTVSVYRYSGGWSTYATGTLASATFQTFAAMHFLPNDNLVIGDNGSSGVSPELWQFTPAGAAVGTNPTSIATLFGTNYSLNDVAVSF